MKKIYVVTGGTLVHVSPHFSLCAPAYGNVGLDIYNRLFTAITDRGLQHRYNVCLVKTKMAGRNSDETVTHLKELGLAESLETNQDLRVFIEATVARAETAGIVMAAAICDFEPVELIALGSSGALTLTKFGKDQKRLHHVRSVTLKMGPSAKIIDLVKGARPDIVLVTFKTAAGVSEAELLSQALYNLRRSKSDLVFANDIQNRRNLVVTPNGDKLWGESRQATLDIFCDELLRRIIQGANSCA